MNHSLRAPFSRAVGRCPLSVVVVVSVITLSIVTIDTATNNTVV